MSKTRQSQIRSLSARFSPGHQIPWHSHTWSQLVYAGEGVVTVEANQSCWVVPCRRAIWVPANLRHQVTMHGRVFLQTIYLKREPGSFGLAECTVVNVPPLLHELIVHVCKIGIVNADSVENRNLIQFLIYQLKNLAAIPLVIPMPRDERARQLSMQILDDPGSNKSLKLLSNDCGTSLRTMQRIFCDEVGLPLARWRKQVKMVRAIQLLAENWSVTDVALELGFESASGFIHSFRQFFGETPGKYQAK